MSDGKSPITHLYCEIKPNDKKCDNVNFITQNYINFGIIFGIELLSKS